MTVSTEEVERLAKDHDDMANTCGEYALESSPMGDNAASDAWYKSQDWHFKTAEALRTLLQEREQLKQKVEKLNRYVKDTGTTVFSCEKCGHARTSKECLHCERNDLREVVEDAKPAVALAVEHACRCRGEFVCTPCKAHQSLQAAEQARQSAPAEAGDKGQDDHHRGLYAKYHVSRVDGRDKPGGEKEGAQYFVLDLTHDPHAIPAIRAYHDACLCHYPTLAVDLYQKYLIGTAYEDVDSPMPQPYPYHSEERIPAEAGDGVGGSCRYANIEVDHTSKGDWIARAHNGGSLVWEATGRTVAELVYRVAQQGEQTPTGPFTDSKGNEWRFERCDDEDA